MKKIFIASDHAGFELKSALILALRDKSYEVEDCGPIAFDASDDYPDYVSVCAKKVAADKNSFGIVLGLSGEGEAIVANRVAGVRAAVYYGGLAEILTLSRQHNDANVLSLGAKYLTVGEATGAALQWLQTPFSNEDRHIRRIAKIDCA